MRPSTVSLCAILLASTGLLGCGGSADPSPVGTTSTSQALCGHGHHHHHRHGLTLRHKHRATFWSGTATSDPADSTQPDVCAANLCAEFTLHVDLPHNVWHHPGGVQVAIRWPTDDNALNLYVYKHDPNTGTDVQVGAAEGFLAAASEGLLLRNAENGDYKVYVALDTADSLDASVDFDALARVQYDPRVNPIRPLRPDLEARPQSHVTFETPSFPFFEADPPPGSTCFNSEMDEDGAHTCLRFDQNMANVGEGPVELRFALPKDPNDTSHDVLERTYYSDGTDHYVDTKAGTWEFHAEHHHYHWDNFAQSNLWASNANGDRLGSAPLRSGRKVSFCVEDENIDNAKWGKRGVGPRTYKAPDCLFTVTSDQLYNYMIQGMTPGWDDAYQWYLPGQYIEVSGIPDGYYIIDTIADPDNKIIESNEKNNCIGVRVKLTNMGTPQRHAEILGAGPACVDK